MEVFTNGGWLPSRGLPAEYILILASNEQLPGHTPITEVNGRFYYATMVTDNVFKWHYAAGSVPLNYQFSEIGSFLTPLPPEVIQAVSRKLEDVPKQSNTDLPNTILEIVQYIYTERS